MSFPDCFQALRLPFALFLLKLLSFFVDFDSRHLSSDLKANTSTLEMETYLLNHLALCSSQLIESNPNAIEKGRIRTGAVQMIFANRTTSAFITPEEVEVLETWGGKSVLAALSELEIEKEVSGKRRQFFLCFEWKKACQGRNLSFSSSY